jgi:glycine/D-amino acid oxidase-like deaminating enzyme
MEPRVVVVGAGIVGASIAWHLARKGARVTVLEAGQTAGGIATRNSFGWINASAGNPDFYFRLRMRSMEEWRRIGHELPSVGVSWCGGLIWDLPPDELDAFVAQHSAWGYPLRRVDASEAHMLEPNLVRPPDRAVHAPLEGAAEGSLAARAFLESAADLGAAILTGMRVLSLKVMAGKVTGVNTPSGVLAADETVIAAGVETSNLAATAECTLPMTSSPGFLVISSPHAKLMEGLLMSPVAHVRQSPTGRLLASTDEPNSGKPGDCAEKVASLLHTLGTMFRGAESLELESYALTDRPDTVDGFPAIGRFGGLAGLYLATMHSGITLAPAVGRFVADEILFGQRDSLLDPFAADRFTTRQKSA